jgi:hypothetical protein
MKLTTTDIIRILPITQETKDSLTSTWESMDPDTRFDLEQILWDAYDTIYDITLDENIKLELLKATQEEVVLDDSFYARMREKTDEQIQKQQQTKIDSSELSSIRQKLETFMQTNSQS